jgi:tetratricopeptide (TPR) repeat protein
MRRSVSNLERQLGLAACLTALAGCCCAAPIATAERAAALEETNSLPGAPAAATSAAAPTTNLETSPLVKGAEVPGAPASTGRVAHAVMPVSWDSQPALTNQFVGTAPKNPASARIAQTLTGLQARLEDARKMIRDGAPREAEPILVELLKHGTPEPIQQSALLSLAAAAQRENDLSRAQQILAQFTSRWSDSPALPEVLLLQGRLYREIGMNNLAVAKFYSVMTSALVLKNDAMDYYQRLVLLAQTEIAETHFQLGHYTEAVDFFSRLLKQNDPALNRASTQYKLVRALSALAHHDETITQAQDYLVHFADTPESAEVRFHLALALKRLGRNNEALQQVLALLQEQKQRRSEHPAMWTYWQQRAGNEIGNQLYREGDYTKALGIYLNVANLDNRPDWQLPVHYQIGLTYERLAQPEKAVQSYQNILKHETELGTNAAPGLKAVVDMARWRIDFIKWRSQAETRVQPAEVAPPKREASVTTPPASS